MDETQATKIAEILGGEAWQSGGDLWLVIIHRADKHIIVISDEVICEYVSEDDFEKTKPTQTILIV